MLPGAETDSLAAVAEQLRAGVESERIPHGASDVSPWVTISVGAAHCRPTRGMPANALIAAADGQLYEAKRLGRNRVCVTELAAPANP